MGTDIHMIAEFYKDGIWHTIRDKIFVEWKGTKFEKKTCVPYSDRNYNLFAILANVRNGSGFAGCRTGEIFNSISEPKGYPEDMDKQSWTYLSEEHSASWLTLKEIYEFDWNQIHRNYGVISEECYRDSIMKGKYPESWCGGISGDKCVIISETEMVNLIQGIIPREKDKEYFTECYFFPLTYSEYAYDFLENMEKLKKYVPKSGTLEDVRIVFDFDS